MYTEGPTICNVIFYMSTNFFDLILSLYYPCKHNFFLTIDPSRWAYVNFPSMMKEFAKYNTNFTYI